LVTIRHITRKPTSTTGKHLQYNVLKIHCSVNHFFPSTLLYWYWYCLDNKTKQMWNECFKDLNWRIWQQNHTLHATNKSKYSFTLQHRKQCYILLYYYMTFVVITVHKTFFINYSHTQHIIILLTNLDNHPLMEKNYVGI
jgi:hypothetical protein